MGKEEELIEFLNKEFNEETQKKFKQESLEDYYYILLEKIYRMDVNLHK